MDHQSTAHLLALRRRLGWIPIRALFSSLQILIGRSFPLLGIFLTGILVARNVGPSDYGRYSAAYAIGSLTVAGVTSGLPLLVIRRAAEDNLSLAMLYRSAHLQGALSAPAVALAAVLGAGILRGTEGAIYGLAAGLGAATNAFGTLGQGVHTAKRHYGRTAATDVVAGSLFPSLTLAALSLHLGALGALFALALAGAISCGIAWTHLPTLDPTGSVPPLRIFDGIPLAVLGIVNAAYARTDAATLIIVAGSMSTGYYSAAYRLLGPFSLIGSAFATMYFSRLSEAHNDGDLRRRIRRVGSGGLALGCLLIAAVLFILAPNIIRGLYGSGYDGAIQPARILLVSVIPWLLYFPKASELTSQHLEKGVAIALAIGFMVDTGLVAGLGHQFGASGAAWAWVASELVMVAGLYYVSHRGSLRVGYWDAPFGGRGRDDSALKGSGC